MKHLVSHSLDAATARKVTDQAWASYQERYSQYQPQANWTSETHADVQFSVKGVTLKGSIDLEPKAVALDLDVPFLLRPFKGQAIAVIEREIRVWIDKANAGQV